MDYNAARKIAHALKMVNNCAERAIKFATYFNEVIIIIIIVLRHENVSHNGSSPLYRS
jgi:hypothetical protein